MQPYGFGPPPFGGPSEQMKEPLPKHWKEVPGYLRRVLGGLFSRLFYIIRLVWEARKSLLLIMIGMAVFNGVSPVIAAYISANLLNRIAGVLAAPGQLTVASFTSALLPALLLQFGYMFAVNLINTVSNMVTRTSGELVSNHVKQKIMNKAKEIDVASFDMPSFYEKLENANREAGSRPIQVIESTFKIVSTFISAITFVVILATAAWFAPIVVILLSLPSAIITFSFRKKNFQYMRHRSKERRQMSYYADTLVNKDLVKEIRLFGLSDTFIVNYKKVFERYFSGIKKLVVQEGAWNLVISLVTTAVNGALFFYIAYTVAFGHGQIGDYSLYTGALTSIASGVAALVATSSRIYEGTLFIDNMIVFMTEKKRIVPSVAQPLPVARHTGHTVEFCHVSFRYPGTEKDVLRDVSFTVKAGDTVVLVGLNGAGKTTLLKLLTRLYDPTDGVILLDGNDIRRYDPTELYAMFGAIFQDFGRYAFTAGENIAFGDVTRAADPDAIRQAAVASSADGFISRLPEGYDTPLMRIFEVSGIEPSVGQWQKIAIARAFYSDSDILILDEPTAALDAIAEQEIFNQFDALRKDKITFFVSHRLSSATIATKILVLENGRLAEAGTHAELMKKRGIYHTLFTTQANRYLAEQEEREAREAREEPEAQEERKNG